MEESVIQGLYQIKVPVQRCISDRSHTMAFRALFQVYGICVLNSFR